MANDSAAPQKDGWSMLGSSGLQQSHGRVADEFLRELQGSRGMQKYKEMERNDPISNAMLGLIGMLFRQSSKFITPADKSSKAAMDAAEFITSAMGDMEHLWMTVEDEFLTCPIYGNSLHEVVFKNRQGPDAASGVPSTFKDGRIGWRCIRLRSQTSIERWVDDPVKGRWVGAEQWVTGKPRVILPLDRCVHFRMTDVLDNPEGRSMLRGGYRSWHFASNLEESEGIALSRSYEGFPLMEVPPNMLDSTDPGTQSRIQELIDQMSSVRSDTSAALLVPASEVNGVKTGFAFRFVSAGNSAPAHDTTIRRHDSRRAMTLFGDFLLLGHDSTGSWSLASTKTNLAALAIGAILDRFCETFTKQAIHPLCAMNGIPREAWPVMEHGDVETPDLDVLAKFINTMVGANVLTLGPELEDYVRTVGGLPKAEQQDFTRPAGEGGSTQPAGGGAATTSGDGTLLAPAVQEQTTNIGLTIRQLSLSIADLVAAGFTQDAEMLRDKIRELTAKL